MALTSAQLTLLDMNDISSGPSFPTSPTPVEGQIHLRTDGQPPYKFYMYKDGDWEPTTYESLEELDPEQYEKLFKSFEAVTSLDDDNKLTRYERSIVRGELIPIVGKQLGDTENMPTIANIDSNLGGDVYSMRKSARDLAVPTTGGEYVRYEEAYNYLRNLLNGYNPKPWSTNTEDVLEVSSADWEAAWQEYFVAHNLLRVLVNQRSKEYTEERSEEAIEEAIRQVSRSESYEEAELDNPTIIEAPITSIGLPSFQGRHADSWEEEGRNILITRNALEDTLIGQSGVTSSDAGNNTTRDFIKVVPGETLQFSQIKSVADSGSTTNYFRYAFYYYPVNDSSYVIDRRASNEEQFSVTVPSGAYWLRVSYYADNQVKIERGSSYTGYSPAPEDRGFDQNRIQPVSAPRFSGAGNLTINARFFGNGSINDLFSWDRNGNAVKTKYWEERLLDGSLNWESRGKGTDKFNLASISKIGNWSTGTTTRNGYRYSLTGPSNGIYIDESVYKPDTKYVFSFKIEKLTGTIDDVAGHSVIAKSETIEVYLDGEYIGNNWSRSGSGPIYTKNVHEFVIIFESKSSITSTSDRMYIQPNRGSNYDKEYTADIWDIQLYEGEYPVPWQPAPEDDPSSGLTHCHVTDFDANAAINSSLVKYDGSIVPSYAETENNVVPNSYRLIRDFLWIMVWNKDSGWGFNYNPTSEEVKAYFNGWKMCNGTFGQPVNGDGHAKIWHPIGDTDLNRADNLEDMDYEGSNNIVNGSSEEDTAQFRQLTVSKSGLVEGQQYMFSVDVKKTSSGTCFIDMYPRDGDAARGFAFSDSIEIDNTYKRLYYYFTMTREILDVSNLQMAVRSNSSVEGNNQNWAITTKEARLVAVDPPSEVSPSIVDKTMNHYQLVYQLQEPQELIVDYEGVLELIQGTNEVTYSTMSGTPDIPEGGKIKYATNLATATEDIRNIIPVLQRKISQAQEVITNDSIVNTVMNSVEYQLAMNSKANTDELGELATRGEIDDLEGRLSDDIWNAIDSIDFSPYVTQSELDQTATNITAKFSATGGMNMIKNSIGFAGMDFFTGATSYTTTIQNNELDRLGFGSGFHIASVSGGYPSIYQTVDVVPNTYYTLSWYENIASNNGYTIMRIYDGSDSEPVIADGRTTGVVTNGYQFKSVTFVPSTNQVTLRMGAYQTEVTYTGLMLNIGDLALKWSLATGELYNTNIRMDINGIRVSQLDEDRNEKGFTQITPEEFAGYYDSEGNGVFEKVFFLNEDETTTKKLRATEEITMGTLKIVKLNSTDYKGWAFIPNIDD